MLMSGWSSNSKYAFLGGNKLLFEYLLLDYEKAIIISRSLNNVIVVM